jgi:hypothetical protein
VAGAGLAAVMLVLGPATALIVDHLQFGGPLPRDNQGETQRQSG